MHPTTLCHPSCTQVAMEHVAKAYYLEEASRRPAVLQAKQVEALVNDCDSGGHTGAFPVDPLVVRSEGTRVGKGWDVVGAAVWLAVDADWPALSSGGAAARSSPMVLDT